MPEHTVDTLICQLAEKSLAKEFRLATAESCTGGLIAAACTELAGSSGWFDRGFVTYSNLSKQQMLSVPLAILDQYGAVSQQTVEAMVLGAINSSEANIALSVSGIAGPGGGSVDKPVGTVWFGWANDQGRVEALCERLGGDRHAVRQQAVIVALEGMLRLIA